MEVKVAQLVGLLDNVGLQWYVWWNFELQNQLVFEFAVLMTVSYIGQQVFSTFHNMQEDAPQAKLNI
jgi:hypothetical protein